MVTCSSRVGKVAPHRDASRCKRSRWNITFDGDTASFNAVYSDEAVAEVRKILNSKMAYVDPRGGFRASTDVETVALVLHNMTGHPKP